MAGEIGRETVGEVRRREGDVLYGLVLLFTYGQMSLIVWEMLSLVPGFALLVGLEDPGRIHSYGEVTSMYLGLLGVYIGRNAWRKYTGKEDAEAVPHYVFLRIQRGYFYLALWGTLCFVAYMLKALTIASAMPHELAITTLGVMAALFGDKAIKNFLDKRTVSQLQTEDASRSSGDRVMEYVEANRRITNQECCTLAGIRNSQATDRSKDTVLIK
ncbi:MAG: hypothetical protein ACYC5N_09215 [Endomicrobiales bacterium]